MKALFLAAYGGNNYRGLPFAQTTLLARHSALVGLARWMVKRGIWRFSDLGADDISEFLLELRPRRADAVLADHTLTIWLKWFYKMWDLRGQYPLSLKVDVRLIEDEVRSHLRVRRIRPWSSLPEDVALTLIDDGIAWLDDYGLSIFDIVQAAWSDFGNMVGRSMNQRQKMRQKFYREFAQSSQFSRLRTALSIEGTPYKVLAAAIAVTEGACAVLLLLMVGMRVSELLALDHDCVGGEPAEKESGLNYLYGPAAKKSGQMRRWVAGYPAPQVVEFMRALSDRARVVQRKPSKALFLTRSLTMGRLMPGAASRRLDEDRLQARIDAFACDGLRRGAVQADHFHPHMARKSFAQLAVRRDKRNLGPVSAHFGHVYQSFTDGRYVGADHQLTELLEQQDREELARGLRHLLASDRLAGGAAPALIQARTEMKFSGKRTLEALVDQMIARGVRLAPCDWGFCVYAKVFSACEGSDEGPNEAKRSPDVCSGCKNFAVSPRHRGWWEERAVREAAFLKLEHLPDQTRAVVERRLIKSQQILANILWVPAPTMKSDA